MSEWTLTRCSGLRDTYNKWRYTDESKIKVEIEFTSKVYGIQSIFLDSEDWGGKDCWFDLTQLKWSTRKINTCSYVDSCVPKAIRSQYHGWMDKTFKVKMHRLIMGGDETIIPDHVDRNGLNNCKSNLWPGTSLDNSHNLSMSKNNTSGICGLSIEPKNHRIKIAVRKNGVLHSRRIPFYDITKKGSQATLPSYEDAMIKAKRLLAELRIKLDSRNGEPVNLPPEIDPTPL
jgi:hypothetical protein